MVGIIFDELGSWKDRNGEVLWKFDCTGRLSPLILCGNPKEIDIDFMNLILELVVRPVSKFQFDGCMIIAEF